MFAVNPNADEVEGDRAYGSLADIPGGVDGVVIATRPERAGATVRECVDPGITRVWMHRGPGAGSVSPGAAAWGASAASPSTTGAARACSGPPPPPATG